MTTARGFRRSDAARRASFARAQPSVQVLPTSDAAS